VFDYCILGDLVNVYLIVTV